jgi:hypothetical protein
MTYTLWVLFKKTYRKNIPVHWLIDDVHHAVFVQFFLMFVKHLDHTYRRETSWSPCPDDNHKDNTYNGNQSYLFQDHWRPTPTSSLDIEKTNSLKKKYKVDTVMQLRLSFFLTSSFLSFVLDSLVKNTERR